MCGESVHPGELVSVFVGFGRVAVGQIKRGDANDAIAVRNHGLDIARVLVTLVAGQAARYLERPLRESGDAVEALLPMHGDIVAAGFDLRVREGGVDAFQFLQADDVGTDLPQIAQQMLGPLPDRIYVPSGDFYVGDLHGRSVSAGKFITPAMDANLRSSGQKCVGGEARPRSGRTPSRRVARRSGPIFDMARKPRPRARSTG